MNASDAAQVYEKCRAELVSFATRLIARPDVASELAQEAALRLLAESALPADSGQVRAWLFRVVNNLSIDYLRRHSTWREDALLAGRETAERDEPFVRESEALRGSAELQSIAREHLAVCFACTLRTVGPERSAALLLREVYQFSTDEAADMLQATPVQVKNWIQQARRTLHDRYDRSCALVNKQGMCHQCVELDGYFNAASRDPLASTSRDVNARLEILRTDRGRVLNPWHRHMLSMLDDVLIS